MATRENKSISLTPEHASFVAACVKSGRYQSASEVVRASLRHLERAELEREAAMAEARRKIQRGADQLDRGDVVDSDRVFKRLAARRKKLRSEGLVE